MSDSSDLQQKIARIAALPNQNDRIKAYQEIFQTSVAAKKLQIAKEVLDHCNSIIRLNIV